MSEPSIPRNELTIAAAGRTLRAFAADPRTRAAFDADGSLLRTLLAPAAGRYVVADNQTDFLARLKVLRDKDYRISAEIVGEEKTEPAEIEAVVTEYLDLIEGDPGTAQLGFDLSNVGLLVSKELAVRNTARILAASRGDVVLSMERSTFTDAILDVFETLAGAHDNVGVTVQAHLYRTEADLPRILATQRKIRLVKGAYREPAGVALPRGPELDSRYLRFAEQVVAHGVPVALATHDAELLDTAAERGLLEVAEIEMLHGVRPTLLRKYHEAGYPCRIYATYGPGWWLHLLHRLAESPPMVLTALADLAEPDTVVFGADY